MVKQYIYFFHSLSINYQYQNFQIYSPFNYVNLFESLLTSLNLFIKQIDSISSDLILVIY